MYAVLEGNASNTTNRYEQKTDTNYQSKAFVAVAALNRSAFSESVTSSMERSLLDKCYKDFLVATCFITYDCLR